MKKLIILAVLLLVTTSAYAMKYRVEIDASFDNKEDAITLLNALEKVKSNAKSIQPSVSSEPTLIMPKKACVYECRHDEIPPKPCSNYEYVDFGSTAKTWK